jgi:hypothetical protein
LGHQLKTSIEEEHTVWLEKQLLGEVLKFQLQQEALRNFFKVRDNGVDRNHDLSIDRNRVNVVSSTSDVLIVELSIVRCAISNLYASLAVSNTPVPAISPSYTLRLLFDKWTCNTSSTSTETAAGQIVWDCAAVVCEGRLTMEALRRGLELTVELHDDSALAATLVAIGTCRISSLVQSGKHCRTL